MLCRYIFWLVDNKKYLQSVKNTVLTNIFIYPNA